MASALLLIGSAGAAILALFFALTPGPSVDDGSKPLGSGEMFDAIAKRYDMVNTALSLGMHHMWRTRMVNSLELKPGHNHPNPDVAS